MAVRTQRLAALACAVLFLVAGVVPAAVIDVEERLAAQFGEGVGKVSVAARATAIEGIARGMRTGDALLLPRRYPIGDLDLSDIPDHVSVHYGFGGRLFLGGRHEGLALSSIDAELVGQRRASFLAKAGEPKGWLTNSSLVGVRNIPNTNQDGNTIVEIISSTKAFEINDITFTNCAVLYVRYHNVSGQGTGPFIVMRNVNAAGSRVYGIVEHNYCEKNNSVVFDNVTGPFYYGNGDTESQGSPLGCYMLKDCNNVTLVSHRNFKSHSRDCHGLAYLLTGGKGVTFYETVDIGDNEVLSIKVVRTEDLRFFGSFFEDEVDYGLVGSGFMRMFHTPFGFGGAPLKKWVEPAVITREEVLNYAGLVIDTATTGVPVIPDGYKLPPPPICPSHKGGSLTANFLQKKSASWGKDAIARGVDVTGRRSSSAIVQQMIREEDFVELPAGTLLFTETVLLPTRAGITYKIVGDGAENTKIVTSGEFPAFADEAVPEGLAKSIRMGLVEAGWELSDVHVSAKGRAAALTITSPHQGQRYSGNVWSGGAAAVLVGDGTTNLHPTGGWDGFDQCRFLNCTFKDAGYGLFCNNGMVDKQLYYKCTFTNLSQGGLCFTNTHMFEASSIVDCGFSNIDGPAVWLGCNAQYGYHPGPSMMMDNTITECGNATRAAVDWGFTRQGLVVNNKITIKNKQWKEAYLGTGQILQGLLVDVDPTKAVGEPIAVALRHPRRSKNNRVTGNFVVNCYSENGKLVFVDDIAETQPANSVMADGKVDYPWAYTHVLYNSSFAGQKYTYNMVQTAKDATVQNMLTFTPGTTQTPIVAPVPTHATRSAAVRWLVYNASGRLIATAKQATPPTHRDLGLTRGVYCVRPATGRASEGVQRIGGVR